jgi:hypothetical protein
MVGNLRPATLFAADKFEGYLQEANRQPSGSRPRKNIKPPAIQVDFDGLTILSSQGEVAFKRFCKENDIDAGRAQAIIGWRPSSSLTQPNRLHCRSILS